MSMDELLARLRAAVRRTAMPAGIAAEQNMVPEPARPRHLVTEPGMGYRFEP